MPRLLAVLLFALACAGCGEGQTRLVAVDVYVDSGELALAAYQFELRCDSAEIVGIEGGEPAHFREPPRYDPAALQGGRVVLAAFTTEPDPPRGRVRVARVHLLEYAAAGGTYRTLQ